MQKNINKIIKTWNLSGPISINPAPAQFLESPLRVSKRLIIKDSVEQEFVLEGFSPELILKKELTGLILDHLDENSDVPVIRLLKTKSEGYFEKCDGLFWQLRKYMKGDKFSRPEYTKDRWRGKSAANLIREISTIQAKLENFSLPHYTVTGFIEDFEKKLEVKNRDILKKIQEPLKSLKKNVLEEINQITQEFSHGDLHPLNIIWEEKQIKGVLDWEFAGFRTAGFDAANFLGCLGFENPDLLGSPLAETFLDTIIEDNILNRKSLEKFKELILITRSMWLSDWLILKDREMISLEIEYLNFLGKLDFRF